MEENRMPTLHIGTPFVRDIEFWCKEDLSQYTDSLLFDEEENIAELKVYDKSGNHIDLLLTVSGDKEVYLIDENGDIVDDEVYEQADDYPEELIEAIKNGSDGVDYACDNNNWFDLRYTVYNARGEEVYYDSEAYESTIHTLNKADLMKDLQEYGEYLLDFSYMRGDITQPKLPAEELSSLVQKKAEKFEEAGQTFRIMDFPQQNYALDVIATKPNVCSLFIVSNGKEFARCPELPVETLGKDIQKVADGTLPFVLESQIAFDKHDYTPIGKLIKESEKKNKETERTSD